MSADIDNIQNLGGFDPLSDATGGDVVSDGEHVHIRIQQRNGKKSLTTIQGLPKKYDYNKVLKALKKDFCCNGTVVDDPELGNVIQLQGDQRKNVVDFLSNQKLAKKDMIKVRPRAPSPPKLFARKLVGARARTHARSSQVLAPASASSCPLRSCGRAVPC